MKLVFLLILAFSLYSGAAQAMDAPANPALPQVKAATCILTDATTGQILYEQNAHARKPMASTTKIMTAILVIEHTKPDDIVTASKKASEAPFTSLHLMPGEKVKVRELLKALLIRSANDTAVALAEHVGGSVPKFAEMMNKKAREIGANDTHFVTPNGLFAKEHYSSAYDLALMARYALRYPEFNEIVGMKRAIVERSMNKEDLLVQTHSKFLRHYPGADGVKSGYIRESGKCFVGSATHNGWRLLSVVMKSQDSQTDTAALMDYGFGRFHKVVLASADKPIATGFVHGGRSEVEAVPEEEVHVVVPNGDSDEPRMEKRLDDIRAPIRKGEKVGTVTAYLGDSMVTSVSLRAAENVDQTLASAAWPWIRPFGLFGLIWIGAICGRAAAKSPRLGRRRFS